MSVSFYDSLTSKQPIPDSGNYCNDFKEYLRKLLLLSEALINTILSKHYKNRIYLIYQTERVETLKDPIAAQELNELTMLNARWK